MDENRQENQFYNSPEVPATAPQPTADAVNGYTVTPQGGYYEAPPQPVPTAVPQPVIPQYVAAPVAPKQKVKKKSHKGAKSVLTVLLALIVGIGGGFGGAWLFNWQNERSGKGTAAQSNNAAYGNAENVSIKVNENSDSIAAAVAQKAMKSVVGIRTTTYVQSFFYGETEATGEGSGVIYSSDGYIITNYHVIEQVVTGGENGKLDVYVGSNDSKPYAAKVIGYNISSDLAVIKIDATGLQPIEIGKAEDLEIGDYVVTIGSPGGLEFMGSVTYGIISGLNRKVSSDSDVPLIQTDAAINPGNSGGALLNKKGQLIGINSSKIVSTEYEGMGFAIPINIVQQKYDKIVNKNEKEEPYIGITVSMKYTAETLAYYGYPAGAVVSGVDENSPAEATGIERGDIITEFNGKKISDPALLAEYLADCTPGKKVPVKIYRSGRYYSSEIKIGSNG
ncbi:MAG: trypsin-like peptidase domain-containing protein [Clostridia bacterium]|nr:trypsin-like peptidase domain-containing protein [Clostridia bacterium]